MQLLSLILTLLIVFSVNESRIYWYSCEVEGKKKTTDFNLDYNFTG